MKTITLIILIVVGLIWLDSIAGPSPKKDVVRIFYGPTVDLKIEKYISDMNERGYITVSVALSESDVIHMKGIVIMRLQN